MDHHLVSSRRDKTGSVTGPEMTEVISLPSKELWHRQPPFPPAIFSYSYLPSNLEQFSEKCENKLAALLPSRCAGAIQ